MRFGWSSSDNTLLLNPRMPGDQKKRFEKAWENWVEGRLSGQVGIATSGSSGESLGRLIVISRKALLTSAAAVNERFLSNQEDVWFKTLPDFHVGGLSIYARAHLSGAQVIEDKSEKWSVKSFHRALSDAKATLLSLVPTQLYDLVQGGFSAPRSLRVVVIGGGRLESELYEKALNLGWPVLPSYGLTECSSQVATATTTHQPALIPLAHVQIRIADRTDEANSSVGLSGGRIEIKSDALLTGQILVHEKGDEFRDPKIDGWFQTEDIGFLNEDGSLSILGRSQDFVKIGGEGVLVSRLEERLENLRLQLSCSFDAAILAVPDQRLGSVLVLLTTASGPEVEKLLSDFNESVFPFERIRRFYSVSEIPRSSLGKLLRAQARALIDF